MTSKMGILILKTLRQPLFKLGNYPSFNTMNMNIILIDPFSWRPHPTVIQAAIKMHVIIFNRVHILLRC